MGIQINGQTDRISAVDGTMTFPGTVTYEDVSRINVVGVVTASSFNSTTGNVVITENANVMFQNSARDTNRGAIQFTDGGDFRLRSGGALSESLRITSAGLVGIGTDTPAAKLEVATSVDGEATLAIFKNTSGGGTNETVDIKLGLEHTVASNVILRAGKESNHGSGASADNFFAIHTTLDNTSSEKMRITSSGALIIGTSTASSLSDRLLTIGKTDRSATYQEIRTSNTGVGGLLFSDGTSGDEGYRGQVDYAHAIDEMRLWTGALTRIRIQGDGTVSYQPTGATTSAHMVMDRSGDVIRVRSQKDGSGSTELSLQTQYNGALNDSLHIYPYGLSSHYSSNHANQTITTAPAGTSSFLYRGHYSGGTICFTVWSSGAIENTTGSVGTISDVKLKENIVDAPSQWDDIKAVKFRKFNFKEETGHETHTQLGVVAQELELTSPGLVYESPDQDVEGKDLGTTTKSVKTSILTMKSLVALQEAMERIETLEQRLSDAGIA